MRLWIIGIGLALAGCATGTGELSGKQSKNGGPVRYERLGVVTKTNVPLEARCGREQVTWCEVKAGRSNCACVHRQDARQRTERLARGLTQLRRYN